MAKARIRQKEGIVKPQVVAGREFKGTAFISKPDKIIFKVIICPSILKNSSWATNSNILHLAANENQYFVVFRISQSAFHTLRRCYSQTFHFPSVHSNCCHWMIRSKTSFTSSTHQLVGCLQVSQPLSRSLSRLSSTRTLTLSSPSWVRLAESIFLLSALARRLWSKLKSHSSILEMLSLVSRVHNTWKLIIKVLYRQKSMLRHPMEKWFPS